MNQEIPLTSTVNAVVLQPFAIVMVTFVSVFLAAIGSLAVFPIDSYGRNKSFPTICGHAGFVTDFDFSPFDGSFLSTGSEDCTVSIFSMYICTSTCLYIHKYMCIRV